MIRGDDARRPSRTPAEEEEEEPFEQTPLLKQPDSLTSASSKAVVDDGDHERGHSSQVSSYGATDESYGEAPSNQQPLPPRKRSIAEIPGIYATLSVLLIGVFISQTDTSLVLATYPRIASEFDDLASGPWLISAFILAECVAMPLYGKLCDIFGRKASLQAAYVLFTIGTIGSGIGSSMAEVIASRAVQGLGGAGMLSMVSIIITDIVPIHEVGPLRSYVNILQTTGRGFGGVIGGFLTETIGWRAAFLVQVPPTILAIILVQWRLRLQHVASHDASATMWTKLKRVDFIGAFFLCLTIGTCCLVLDSVGGQTLAWSSPIIIGCIVVGSVSAIAFVISGHYAAEPIFPLHLWVKRAVLTNYAIVLLTVTQQISLMASVPLFVQATSKVSQAQVGTYLIPAFFGNLVGGLIAGFWCKHTRTHKPVTLFGPFMGALSVVLCLFLWTGDGPVSIPKSLAIFPGGFGNGAVASSAFIALTAGVLPKEVAIAGSGMFLFFNLGAIAGVSGGSALYRRTLAEALHRIFHDVHGGKAIIREALRDVTYVQNAEPEIKALLVPAFVEAFHSVNYLGLACSTLAFLFAIISPNSPMRSAKEEQQIEATEEPV